MLWLVCRCGRPLFEVGWDSWREQDGVDWPIQENARPGVDWRPDRNQDSPLGRDWTHNLTCPDCGQEWALSERQLTEWWQEHCEPLSDANPPRVVRVVLGKDVLNA